MAIGTRTPLRLALRGAAFLGGAGALGVAAGGTALAVGARCWIRPRRLLHDPPSRSGLETEDVSFLSADGTTRLCGWFLPQPDAGAPALVLCHGYQRSSEEAQHLGLDLHVLGYQVLLFDFRACGRSGGEFTTIGYHEVDDLVGATAYLASRLPAGTPIGVHGLSMGAAVAIIGAAQTEQIRAVVADSPFATLLGAIDLRLRSEPNRLNSLAQRVSIRVAEHMVKVKASQVRPIDHVESIGPRPLLLIHGTRDEVVSHIDSLSLYQRASGPKDLWLVEGSSHCAVRFDRPREYLERVDSFFRTAFRRPSVAPGHA